MRKEKGLSQAQLAGRLSVSSQAVGKWERGESMPDIIMFNRLAEILEVDLNYFSENFPPAASGKASAESSTDRSARLPSAKPGKKAWLRYVRRELGGRGFFKPEEPARKIQFFQHAAMPVYRFGDVRASAERQQCRRL
ncbi:MAG: helix-turn-helix transcriptional regulator [Oscillospiraceae bacterium]|nr:helix-turn-helix transcriptional regulator [Oscillospiraceae bacterium]